jgi:hypothetical protein
MSESMDGLVVNRHLNDVEFVVGVRRGKYIK